MADRINVGCLQSILVQGDDNFGSVCLQIISLKTTSNTATMEFSDTKFKTEPIKIDLPDPTVLKLFAVVQLSYTLERSESSASSEKFKMVRIEMTGINKKPSGIIGNPIYIGENADSGEFFRNSSVNTNDLSTAQHLLACDSLLNATHTPSTSEELSYKQELAMYLRRDIAKLKLRSLRRTTLTNMKKQHEDQMKKFEIDKFDIEKKITNVHEQINHFHARYEIVIVKMAEIQQKIDKYSKQ